MGIAYTEEDLYAHVLAMEQIMSTGGGFLQVILKKGVTRQQVEERLNEVFMDSLVGVADCRLVWE